MAFMVEEGYFNIGLIFGECNSHDSEWLKQLHFGLDHFFLSVTKVAVFHQVTQVQ